MAAATNPELLRSQPRWDDPERHAARNCIPPLADSQAGFVLTGPKGSVADVGHIRKFVLLFALAAHRAVLYSGVFDLIVEGRLRAPLHVSVAQNFKTDFRLGALNIGVDNEVELESERLVGKERGIEQRSDGLTVIHQNLVRLETVGSLVQGRTNIGSLTPRPGKLSVARSDSRAVLDTPASKSSTAPSA